MRAGSPSLGRALFAGLMSGGGSGVTANLVAAAIGSVTAEAYPELSPIAIAAVSVATSLVGGLAFYAIARRALHPRLSFALLALFTASLASLVVLVSKPAGFAKIAIPAHFVVGLLAIAVIPRIALAARRLRRPPAAATVPPPR